jgi:nitrate/TMAO reductase-like tetraheme cytochrome c subunit
MVKYNLMLIATIAIGIFALPIVSSTFSGSHAYIAGENVECLKCHADVEAELASSSTNHTHANDDWTVKQMLDCDECHNVSGIGESLGGGHAAQKVDCAFCHDNTTFGIGYFDFMHGLRVEYGMDCLDCHYGTDYDETDMFLDDVFNEITLETAAHYTFYQNAVNDSTLLGGTESCVGCHTHAEVNFTQPLGTYSMTYDPITGVFGKE